jgi:hypothetical protein
MRRLLFLIAVLALTVFAQDFAGTWKGTLETPNGSFDQTLVLKASGDTFTGTVSGPGGDMKIDNVKVAADKITFSMTMDFGTLNYSCTVKGDDMKMSITFGGGDMPPMETTLKRAK